MDNHAIAERLREFGLYYEMLGVAFKPAAYERAAETVDALGEPVAALFKEGGRAALDALPGIGAGIAADIADLLRRRVPPELAKLRKRYPVDMLGLTAVGSVGPKTVRLLFERLGVRTVRQLEKAVRAKKVRALPGMGARSEARILEGIAVLGRLSGRQMLGYVLPLAGSIVADLRALPGVTNAEYAGSLRRRQETIGDIDIIVTTDDPEAVMAAFTGFPEVAKVLEHGRTKTVVRYKNGMQGDVRVVAPEEYGAALQYYTGSKEHNVVVRKLAIAKGLKLNEYGIWRGKKRIASRTEQDVYRALGLPYIAPELRTASGEVEAARKRRLPALVPYGAVRGDLQTQTSWTDGSASIEEMAEGAYARGLQYIVITDHTRSLAMTGGLDERGLARQAKEIAAVNRMFARRPRPFRVFTGAEVNILKDGSLDISDAALAKLDFVGAAIHSHFNLDAAAQTARLVRAMSHPHVDAIFHPTCRIIGKREPIALDMDAVVAAAKRTRTVLEIDAYPGRSDLRDVHVRAAVAAGVRLAIDTDAHAVPHLDFLDLGVAIARRGWATARDIVNTRTLASFEKWLRTPKTRRD